MPRAFPLSLIWAGLFLALAYAALGFADLDRLTSFADDGVSYLIMAQHYSPFADAPAVVRDAYAAERYPPLFPVLLAILGGAEDLARAHQMVALSFLAACAVIALWAVRTLGSPWLGLLAVLIFISSPNVWPLLLRVVSEYQYLALTLGALLAAERARNGDIRWLLVLAALLSAAVFTRAIGIALVAAWGVHLLAGQGRGRSPGLTGAVPLVLPPALAAAWFLSRPLAAEHHYTSKLGGLLERLGSSPQPLAELLGHVAPQWEALQEGWMGALMLLWQPDANPRVLLALALAVVAGAGWLLRLRQNRLDAWYVAFYLAILLIWPFPGQVFRFILPLLPLLIVYALQVCQVLGARLGPLWAGSLPLIGGVAFLALTTPATLFVYQRSLQPPGHGLDYASNPEFYQEADLALATRKATLHLLLARDLERIRATTPPGAKVMWFTPNYLALLAQRRGVRFPDVAGREAMQAAIARDPPGFVYVSRLHPRRTTDDGLAMLAWAGEAGPVQWATLTPGSQAPFSVLLRIDPNTGAAPP